jgi:hypothetical protein
MKRLLALCLVTGCGVSVFPSSDDDDASRTVQPQEDSPYQIVNRIDITVEAILPDQAELTVSTLRALSTNPAGALINAADEAGVPAVGELYGGLPAPVKDRLEDWINDEIVTVEIDGLSIPEYAGQIAALADTALTHFAVDSELTIHAGVATHRLTALDLTPSGLPIRLPLGGLAGDLLTQDTTAGVSRGALALGEQHFGLDYGEYAWQGIEAASRAGHGEGVRDRLGHAVNCPNLAHNVAGKCILGVCVGHQAQLTSLCEGGLDAIVDLAHERMTEIRLEALHLANGQATLIDNDGDGVADRITGGTWQAEINLGLGLRHAPASFTGTR